jgi:hypothetical protein
MRKPISAVLALTTLLVTPGLSDAAAPKAAAPKSAVVEGWSIKQKMEYQGPVEILATKDAAKIKTRTLCVFMETNKADCTLVNEQNKTVTTVDKRAWTDRGLVNKLLAHDAPPEVLKEYKIKLKPPKMIAGHKCKQRWAVAYRHDKTFWFWWEYWTTDDIKIPKALSDTWRTMMHLPTGEGVPLEAYRHFHYGRPNYEIMHFLSTSEAKPVSIKLAEVQVPTNYKRVGDELDMVIGTETKEEDEIADLFADKKKTVPAKPPGKK